MKKTYVFVVLDRWSYDPWEVNAVFATEQGADAYVTDCVRNADDYEQSRHEYRIDRHEVRP